MKSKINWDVFGILASIACAIHCAVLPLFLSSLSLLGVNIIENTFFEAGMIALAFFIGLYSLRHGIKKHHHNWLPICFFSIGIILLICKQLNHQWQLWLLPPAVFFVVLAHYLNYRFSKLHQETCKH